MVMTERLEALPPMDELLVQASGSAKGVLDEVLYGMPYAQLDDRGVHHGCACDIATVIAALSTVAPSEIASMLADDDFIELDCDYCKKSYQIGHAHLAGLLTTS
jgi:molecular chaperone Hsp33